MIEVNNVSFEYNKKDHALKNVSFKIEDHEWISIIGHNGSGKSTLAKLLVGLIFPTQGNIKYNGEDFNEQTIQSFRKRIGIVFQNPDNQFVGYNVRYDIAFGLENYQVPREKMEELILEYTKKVDMDKYLEREPVTLSGGQKQRVAIAGILALDCETIILDEATSMLDPEGTKEIIDLIKVLREKYNKTIITITHDLELARLSDHVIVLRNGSIIKDGTAEEILEERELLLSSNLDMPFSLKVDYLAKNDPVLSKNEKLMEALWEYRFKK